MVLNIKSADSKEACSELWPVDKSALSHAKHMLWVLKRTVSKHMLRLMNKKMFTILHSKCLLNNKSNSGSFVKCILGTIWQA